MSVGSIGLGFQIGFFQPMVAQLRVRVTLSSTEAEYVEQTAAATNVVWARNVLKELKIKDTKDPIVIYADNQDVIKLTTNSIFRKRIKHIAIKYHYIRNLIQQKKITLQFKLSNEMIANDLTKSLESIKFQKFVIALDLKSSKASQKSENQTMTLGQIETRNWDETKLRHKHQETD
jgi:hypothetical protein